MKNGIAGLIKHKKNPKSKKTQAEDLLEKEGDNKESGANNIISKMEDRLELQVTFLKDYLKYLDHTDEEHLFSDFNDCIECFYEYHDIFAVLENKVSYYDMLLHDLNKFGSNNDEDSLLKVAGLSLDHINSVNHITSEQLDMMQDLFADHLDSPKDK
jgi:hypothetical protein